MASRASRRAPKIVGYATDAKQQWREAVYSRMAFYAPRPPSQCTLLLMPSTEGLEIEVAQRYGFRLEKMVVVDDNPAVVATLRRKYPNLKDTYGVSLERALERIAAEGERLDVVSADLTSNLSQKIAPTITCLGSYQHYCPGSLLMVNITKGREQPRVFAGLQEMEVKVAALAGQPTVSLDARSSGDPSIVSATERKAKCGRYMETVYANGHRSRKYLPPFSTNARHLEIWAMLGPCWVAQTKPASYVSNRTPMQWATWRYTRNAISVTGAPIRSVLSPEEKTA